MSNQVEPFVQCPKKIMYRTDLSPVSRVFYSGLLHFDRGRGCWASRETLSKLTGLSEYQIRESIKELIEVGLITEKRRGQGKTNIINIVSMSGDQIEEDTKEVEEPEPKTIENRPIIVYKDTNEGDLDDKDLVSYDEKPSQTDASNDHSEQIRIHKDETDRFLEDTSERFTPTYERMVQGTHIIDSDSSQSTLLVTSEIVRDFIQKHYKSKIEQMIGKEFRIVGS